MIPEKIYRCGNCLSNLDFKPCGCGNSGFGYLEYTRTPIAKKFSDEQPTIEKDYWVSVGGTDWIIAAWKNCVPAVGGGWFDTIKEPVYWAEIILPIVEE